MSVAVGRTVLHCRCDQRVRAHARGEFLWSYTRSSWYFPDVLRQQTWRARYHEFKPDHSDEPVEFFDCPWCGNVLPGMQDEQADGA